MTNERRAKFLKQLDDITPEYDAIFAKWREGMSYSDIVEDVGSARAYQTVILSVLIARIAELERKVKYLEASK